LHDNPLDAFWRGQLMWRQMLHQPEAKVRVTSPVIRWRQSMRNACRAD